MRVEEQTVDAMEAAVIAELVKAGVPYADARAQVLGGASPQTARPAPAAMGADDDDEPVIPQKSKDFSDDQVALYEQLQSIEESKEYEVSITVPSYLMDWVIRKTLQEAYVRNNPEFLVDDFLILMLKEQRAIDPTKGGKVTGGRSGPKDLYNPMTEKWG